jgi:hypothetical protein
LPPETQADLAAIRAARAWHEPCESSGMNDDSRIRYLVQVAAVLAIVVSLLMIL